MKKIIGFLITKNGDIPAFDFFNIGLNYEVIKHGNYNVYIWGIGDISECKIKGKYSLSFPLNNSLLDRNVLISFNDNNIIVENDWLGAIPVFYNTKEKIVSTISNFCLKDKKINDEGLKNFCEFGYSVFEQTMFEDVKFLRYSSRLVINDDNIKLEYDNDFVVEHFSGQESKEDDVINLLKKYILDIESSVEGDIILPTSGGYDSRLLNYLIEDKNKIKSFTYGISKNQSKSVEVVYAKKLSEIYKTKWAQIELKKFNKYINKWFEIYGYSTHLHGMYHIEFYDNILKNYSFNKPTLLSGIFGDVWAGSVNYNKIKRYEDVINLGYTHGLNIKPKYLKIISNNIIKKKFFELNKEGLENNKIRAIFTIRTKMPLISYLTQIPEYFGVPAWTPFLNFGVAEAMLNIKEKRRKNRIWQKDFFKKTELDLEKFNLKFDRSNSLDYDIAINSNFEPINIGLMKTYIKEEKLAMVNLRLKRVTLFDKAKNKLLSTRSIGSVLKSLGTKNEYLKSLYEYYIIKAIEKSIKYET